MTLTEKHELGVKLYMNSGVWTLDYFNICGDNEKSSTKQQSKKWKNCTLDAAVRI